MHPARYCICNNPSPMTLKQGSRGPFYSCSDPGCKLTQDPNIPAEKYVRGSTAAAEHQDTPQQARQAWELQCNSITQGYLARKAWHEKHGVTFPETRTPPLPPAPGSSTGGNVRDLWT
jgi:hypothetical protein